MKPTKEQIAWHTTPTPPAKLPPIHPLQKLPTKKGTQALNELATPTPPTTTYAHQTTNPALKNTLKNTALPQALQAHPELFGKLTPQLLTTLATRLPLHHALQHTNTIIQTIHQTRKTTKTHLIYTWALTLIAALTTLQLTTVHPHPVLLTATLTALILTVALTTLATLETYTTLPPLHLTPTSSINEQQQITKSLTKLLTQNHTPKATITRLINQTDLPHLRSNPTPKYPTWLTHHLPTITATITITTATMTTLIIN